MSAAGELRALMEAGAGVPWHHVPRSGSVVTASVGYSVASCTHVADAALIVWVVNRAERIADLVEAAEAVLAAPPHRADHGQYCARCVIEGDLLDALAALEAEA